MHAKADLGNKNKIALAGGVLIAAAFLNRWTLGSTAIFEWALIVASVLGILPIAIRPIKPSGSGL